MKIKTADLTGAALDWAVKKADGDQHDARFADWDGFGRVVASHYSSDWHHAGRIIDREGILFHGLHGNYHAWIPANSPTPRQRACYGDGPTHLIAAMRCFVASKLGDEVDVPEELTI